MKLTVDPTRRGETDQTLVPAHGVIQASNMQLT